MAPVVVLRIVTRLNVGGPTRQIASLMSRLDPARYSQILVTGRARADEGEGLIDVPGERVVLEELQRPIAPLSDWRAYGKLVALCRRLRPAIVHTHQAKGGVVGRMAAAAAGVPVVIHTYHGHTFRRYFGWPKSALLRSAEKLAAARSTALIAQAESQADDVASFLGAAARKKTRVIPPGIELPEAAAAAPRPTGRMRIVYPARLEPVKDPLLALEVLRRLPPEFELHVFGDGSLRGAFERSVRAAGLAERVTIHPASHDRGLLYEGKAVTLLTSREEGTPLALLESQAWSVPVVAPDVGAVRSVVAPGGGQVVKRHAAALAAGVIEAARSGTSPGVPAWVRERFSAARMVGDVAGLYEELLAGRRVVD